MIFDLIKVLGSDVGGLYKEKLGKLLLRVG